MTLFDPRIENHLIADQGEVVIDEVHKHWAAVVGALLELFAGTVVLLLVFFVPSQAWWVPVVLGGGLALHATWRILDRRTDIFVITNMRVFRVHGILSRNIATMPLSRILDISVHKPAIGRMLGYGHFVFESAAQAQGLREIRYVGDPDGRGLTIQRVIQQAGLRGFNPQHPMPAQRREAGIQERPPAPEPAPAGETVIDADWLAATRRREDERLAELRGEHLTLPLAPFDPDRTSTAPIDLPR